MATQPSKATWERIRNDFLASGDAARALAERTAWVDRLVLQTACERLLTEAPGGVAVLAVGGYGRRQLFPHSDVDLLLLFQDERLMESSRAAISQLIQDLWDAGLRVSHSVRTPQECAEVHERNIELNVSLLDQRYLGGDRRLYAELAERLPRFLRSQRETLTRNLARLTRERHENFHHTYYHLEPNVKDAPGGLRDLQLLCWLERIRHGAAELPEDLVRAEQFLWRLRCLLHCRAGRDNNSLTFDAQESAAEFWGSDDPAAWMRDYFRHARAVYTGASRALEAVEGQNSNLLAQFRDWRTRLSNAEFSVSRDRVHLREPHRLETDPDAALRLFQFVARHGLRLSADTEQRVTRYPPREAAWPQLAELLSLPHAPLALRTMHETGVLRVLFPEMEFIECLVIRDFYHRYTVDEHTLVAIQNVCALRQTDDPAKKGYADLLSEIGSPAEIVFALLFHDAGKGVNGQGPVDASVELVEGAMARIRMPQAARATVRFLIAQHLVLSAAMTSRDLSDPATAQDLAHRIETVERLKALTLVTHADISAVNPTAMTPWRAEQLWRLYLLVYNELTRELDAERIGQPPAAETERGAFLAGFPTRYLRTHSEEEMEEDLALEEKSRRRGVAVELKKLDSAYRLTLVASDRPFLFASVAGTLSAFGLNILKAEAFGNRRGAVLDTFTFADPGRTLELNPSEVDRLRTTLERVVLGKADVKQLLQNRPKPSPPSKRARIEATVAVDGEASQTATLIHVVAEDRPGLLYELAAAISSQAGNIEVVLIDTQAHKAVDVFYVTKGGSKLGPGDQEQIARAMRAVC